MMIQQEVKAFITANQKSSLSTPLLGHPKGHQISTRRWARHAQWKDQGHHQRLQEGKVSAGG